jgi:hypothetical protein
MLDLIIEEKFEAEDLIRLSSHGAEARELGSLLLWFPDVGYAGTNPYPDESWESSVPHAFSKAFSSIIPLLGAWTTYTSIHALSVILLMRVLQLHSPSTRHSSSQFSMQYKWNAVLHYHYEFTHIHLQENFLWRIGIM